MLFSTGIPLDALVNFCRMVRHGLAAGLSLVDVFRQQAAKGPRPIQPVAQAVVAHLERGESLEDALKREGRRLPPLFHSMAAVGEQSGNLPEVMHELERYFQLQSTLRKRFIADITWPVIQFVMAIGVIALLLCVLGWIAPAGQAPLDPLGLGLTGERGAMIFLLIVGGTLVGFWLAWHVVTETFQKKAVVERFLLRVPALGPCLEAIALTRFCLAMRLTMGAGLPVKHALRRSLEATDNAAYSAHFDEAQALIRQGEDLTTVMRACNIFPEDFLNIASSAEEGGRVAEVMEQQSGYYQEEASRRMTILARVAGFGVWAFVAVLLILAIFRIFFTYIRLIDPATHGL